MSSAVTSPGIKRAVYEGRIHHTNGKLTRGDLTVNKDGRVVSRRASANAKKKYNRLGNDGPKGWILACREASKILGDWPVPVRKGTKFYKLAKEIHNEMR
jgi:hypothetical protein